MSNIPAALWKGANVIHRSIFDLTDGKLGGSVLGMPVLKLTTTGARSGRPRTVMLSSPLRVGDAVVIVASKGGDDRSPAWFHNLVANPEVELTMGGTTRKMTARVAEGTEREQLWDEVTARYGNYADYQRRTDREIPVVVLEP